jgi:hypothetical protein
MIILIFPFLVSFYLLILGNFILTKLFKNFNSNRAIEYIVSIIFLSNLFLILNFFTSLNKYINTLVFIIPLIYIFLLNKKLIFELITISLIFSVFFVFLISFDNINRPDGGLYHLPYISALNENKIIIGLANLHFRFGHTSILQYFEAGFNNIIFKEIGILIPKSILFFSICLYFLKEFQLNLKSKKVFFSILSFLIFFQIFYDMNRYSYQGNDVPAHLIILFVSYFFLRNDISKYNNFFLISIICLFAFQIKSTSIVMLLLPLAIIILNKKIDFLYKSKNIIIIIFTISWLVKNVLISGCFIFPIKQTCLNSLYWNSSLVPSENDVFKVSEENEAWAKGWPDRKDKSLNYENFIKSNWIKIWYKSHGQNVVLKKIIPLILIILIIYLLVRNELKNNEENKFIYKKNFILFSTLFLGTILWFFKFPTYRYGSSYVIGSIIFSQFYLFKCSNINENLKKILKILIFLTLTVVFLKYLTKYENSKNVWPNIYSFETNAQKPLEFEKIYKDNKLLYYHTGGGKVCMYSPSPCTNVSVHEDVNLKIVNGHKIYYLEIK